MSAGELETGKKAEPVKPKKTICMDCGTPLEDEFVPIYDWYSSEEPQIIGRLCLDCYNSACVHCHGMGCLGECAYD